MAMFNPGDLIWAKMKGHPHWPAMVLSNDDVPFPCPGGKQPVLFFGTNETGFMKPSDLDAYLPHREKYEIPRKLKGFNQALKEIRQEAGLASLPELESPPGSAQRAGISSSPKTPAGKNKTDSNSKTPAKMVPPIRLSIGKSPEGDQVVSVSASGRRRRAKVFEDFVAPSGGGSKTPTTPSTASTPSGKRTKLAPGSNSSTPVTAVGVGDLKLEVMDTFESETTQPNASNQGNKLIEAEQCAKNSGSRVKSEGEHEGAKSSDRPHSNSSNEGSMELLSDIAKKSGKKEKQSDAEATAVLSKSSTGPAQAEPEKRTRKRKPLGSFGGQRRKALDQQPTPDSTEPDSVSMEETHVDSATRDEDVDSEEDEHRLVIDESAKPSKQTHNRRKQNKEKQPSTGGRKRKSTQEDTNKPHDAQPHSHSSAIDEELAGKEGEKEAEVAELGGAGVDLDAALAALTSSHNSESNQEDTSTTAPYDGKERDLDIKPEIDDQFISEAYSKGRRHHDDSETAQGSPSVRSRRVPKRKSFDDFVVMGAFGKGTPSGEKQKQPISPFTATTPAKPVSSITVNSGPVVERNAKEEQSPKVSSSSTSSGIKSKKKSFLKDILCGGITEKLQSPYTPSKAPQRKVKKGHLTDTAKSLIKPASLTEPEDDIPVVVIKEEPDMAEQEEPNTTPSTPLEEKSMSRRQLCVKCGGKVRLARDQTGRVRYRCKDKGCKAWGGYIGEKPVESEAEKKKTVTLKIKVPGEEIRSADNDATGRPTPTKSSIDTPGKGKDGAIVTQKITLKSVLEAEKELNKMKQKLALQQKKSRNKSKSPTKSRTGSSSKDNKRRPRPPSLLREDPGDVLEFEEGEMQVEPLLKPQTEDNRSATATPDPISSFVSSEAAFSHKRFAPDISDSSPKKKARGRPAKDRREEQRDIHEELRLMKGTKHRLSPQPPMLGGQGEGHSRYTPSPAPPQHDKIKHMWETRGRVRKPAGIKLTGDTEGGKGGKKTGRWKNGKSRTITPLPSTSTSPRKATPTPSKTTPPTPKAKGRVAPLVKPQQGRSVSPIPAEALRFQPGYVETRSRWWRFGKKKLRPPSPPRPFEMNTMDSTACFKIVGKCLEAVGERVRKSGDESEGVEAGSLDLLMDSLVGSMGPLLGLTQKIPQLNVMDKDKLHSAWESASPFLPQWPVAIHNVYP